jgi:hypothetical protein
MSYTNEFLPVATGNGANVRDQADFAGSAIQLTGFEDGPAEAPDANKVWRQSSTWAATLGQIIADFGGTDALDDGNVASLETEFIAAIEGALNGVLVHVALADTGTQNNVVIATTPSFTNVTAPCLIVFKPAYLNNGACTVDPNGTGPFSLVNTNQTPLNTGQLYSNGLAIAAFDGTNFELLFSTPSNTLDFSGNAGTFPAGLGVILAQDPVGVGGPGNQLYTTTVSDYAGITAPNTIKDATNAFTATNGIGGGARWPIVQDSLKAYYVFGVNFTTTAMVWKYDPNGNFLGATTIDAAAAGLLYAPRMFTLSNSDICCVWAEASGALHYAIIDTALNVVVAATPIDTTYASSSVTYPYAIPLSTGGFAIAYQSAAATAINLATYGNNGVQTLAPTPIQVLTSTAAIAYIRMEELSNHNLVVAFRTIMSPNGTSFTVRNPTTGAGVVASTVIDTTALAGFIDLKVVPAGFFAVSVPNGTNMIVGVYSNAGALQGSKYSAAHTSNPTTYIHHRLLTDTVGFFVVYADGSGNYIDVGPIPTAGGGVETKCAATIGTGCALDATITNGVISVIAASNSTGGQTWTTIGMPNTALAIALPYTRVSPTEMGNTSRQNGAAFPRIFNAGDWVNIMLYENLSAGTVSMMIQKIEASSFMGVAETGCGAVSPGTLIAVLVGPGTYPCNTVGGTTGQLYDQSVANPAGNSVGFYTNTVILKGIIPTAVTPSLTVNSYGSIGQGQPVQLGPDHTVYSTQVTNYAAVTNAGTVIVNETTVTTQTFSTNAYGPLPVVTVKTTGDVIVVGAAAGPHLYLYRYNAGGTFKNFIVVDASAVIYDPHLDTLPNGNVVTSWSDGTNVNFAIYDNLLQTQVVAKTPIEAQYTSNFQHHMRVHPNGSIVLAYQLSTKVSRLAAYDMNGVLVVSPVTISTWSTSPGNVCHGLDFFPSGNILVHAISPAYGASFGIYSPIGATVTAWTNWYGSAISMSYRYLPPMACVAGNFAVALYDGSHHRARVYNEAGIIIGSELTKTATSYLTCPILVADRARSLFWLQADGFSTVNYLDLYKLPIGGANLFTLYPNVYSLGWVSGVLYPSAFYENGYLVTTWALLSYCYYAVWNTVDYSVYAPPTVVSTHATPYWPNAMPGGDFTLVHTLCTSTSHYLTVIKYANTAILGVANGTYVAGGVIRVNNFPATYLVPKQLAGQFTSTFDHTVNTCNIYGNKGSFVGNNLIIRGM